MPPSVRRRQHGSSRNGKVGPPSAGRGKVGHAAVGRRAWLAPPIGVVVIVGLASAATLAQSTEWVFIAASLVFSLCEGVVLAVVGFTWAHRGVGAAMLASVATAVVAAPLRWEVAIFTRRGVSAPEPMDLVVDLAVSVAWGAIAGLAGATILRPKLAAIMQDAENRFGSRPRR
jgi:hypothetical protein